MEPLIERLEKELHVKVEKYETWHDAKNAKKLEEHDNGDCGGVPFFVNTTSGMKICGETSYDVLKTWASGDGAEASK